MSGTKVQIKYGYGTPAPGSLKLAELAIDLNDESLWTADSDGNIVRVGHNTDGIEIDIDQILEELKDRVLHNDERNIIEEGAFQIVWRDDDPSYDSFTGTIGYNRGASDDPNGIEGSFVFAGGVNEKTGLQATLSIGRDADLELEGDNAIRGKAGAGGHTPIVEGFKHVQAGDFLDANGDSIIGNHDSDIANLQGQINNNANNISDNAQGIGNNAKDIEQLKNDFNNHDHAGVYEPVISPKNSAFNKSFAGSGSANTVSRSDHTHNYAPIDHDHSGVYEPVINPKRTAFNKDFGTTASTVAEGSHKHALDDLSDVSAASPSRDDLLVWTGTSWSASSFDLIETALNFKGATNVAQAAPAAEQGDLYVNNTQGTAAASWTGIAGKVVNAGNFIGYANGRWYLLGEIADVGVTQVVQGLAISVDDSKPAEPVVSVDRAETDKWYADKGHNHSGVYEPVINPKNSAFNKSFAGSGSAVTVSRSDHTHSQYLTDYTETDPTVPGHVKSISTTNISNWNAAHGWGNHASAGYIKDYTETDPTVPAHVKSITPTNISNWNSAHGWGDHGSQGYLKKETVSAGSGSTVSDIKIVIGKTGTDPNTLYFVV